MGFIQNTGGLTVFCDYNCCADLVVLVKKSGHNLSALT
jgi:hypothetical protein